MTTRKLATLCREFKRDEGGNFAITFAFAAVAIFLSVGLAVDFSRSIGTKTRINNALDSATLATARALSIGEITRPQADAYLSALFAANIGVDNLADSKYSIDNITIDPVNQTVTASASYDQKLLFMQVGTDKSTQVVGSLSASSYGQSDIEISMVLDVTGSMGGSRISSLKAAAKLGVEELLKVNTDTDEHIRISLVPYSDSVNAGPLAKYVYPDYDESKSNAPVFSAQKFNDTGIGYEKDFLLDQYGECNWSGSCWFPSDYKIKNDGSSHDSCATDRKAPSSGKSYQYSDANPSKGMISRDSRLPKYGCTSSEIVLLSSDETKLKNAISGLSTGGCTAGHIGLQWAWYTISKEWADYVPAASKPGDMSTDDELSKYIILMTDGAFNTAYAGTNSSRVGCRKSSLSKTHTNALCNAVKGSNVKIFTIGFQTSNSAESLLAACASPDEGQITYHYEPDTASELKATYEAIANTIQSLRLIQ